MDKIAVDEFLYEKNIVEEFYIRKYHRRCRLYTEMCSLMSFLYEITIVDDVSNKKIHR